MFIHVFADLEKHQHELQILSLLFSTEKHSLRAYDFKHSSISPADIGIHHEGINPVGLFRCKYNILIIGSHYELIEDYSHKIDIVLCKDENLLDTLQSSIKRKRYLGWTHWDKLKNGNFMPKSNPEYYTILTHTNQQKVLELCNRWPLANQKLKVYSRLPTDSPLILDFIICSNIEVYTEYDTKGSIFIDLMDQSYQYIYEASSGSIIVSQIDYLKYQGQYVYKDIDDLCLILSKIDETLDDKAKIIEKSERSREFFIKNQREFLERFTHIFYKIFTKYFSSNNDKISPRLNNKSPLVSIITPTRNRAKLFNYISLYNWNHLTYENREWIIIDDSDDGSKLELPDVPNIHYIQLDSETPIGEKRNIGIAKAKGEYIMCMDDDDYYHADVIQKRLAENSDCSYCSTISCFNVLIGSSFLNTPPLIDPPYKRVSEATLFFKKSFWQDRKFPSEILRGEGEEFIKDRYNQCIEVDWKGIIVSLQHKNNISGRFIPSIEPNGNHFLNNEWGMTADFAKLLSEIDWN